MKNLFLNECANEIGNLTKHETPNNKEEYLKAREDVVKLDDSIVPNGIGKVLKKLHLFAVQFYQPDFEVTAMNSPDLTKELSGLVTSLFLTTIDCSFKNSNFCSNLSFLTSINKLINFR